MFCYHCGKDVGEGDTFCPYCGAQVKNALQNNTAARPVAQANEKNVLSLVGFILSFFVPLAGLICSIIGFKQCKERNDDWKAFAIAGIVISSVEMFAALAVLLTYIGLFSYMFSIMAMIA